MSRSITTKLLLFSFLLIGIILFILLYSKKPTPIEISNKNLPDSPVENSPLTRDNSSFNPAHSVRTLPIPSFPEETTDPVINESAPISSHETRPDTRAAGRKDREGRPLGVVLWNDVNVFSAAEGPSTIYKLNTGDFVRILDEGTASQNRIHIHPGLDIYLQATTKNMGASGLHLPDQSGWIEKSNLNTFEPQEAKEFLFELTPITLGNDPTFSTIEFYERGMKNVDPVVHRVMGPRLISIVTQHQGYASYWFTLIRDPDSAIRTVTLKALRSRGLGNDRVVIENLIQRLIELTQIRAENETEDEAFLVLAILEETQHDRVPAALVSLQESWKSTQGEKLNTALEKILTRN